VFIADKGFYSAANIKALEEENLKYLIPLRRNNLAVDYGPLEANEFKRNLKHFTYQKRIIWYYKYSKDGSNYITFLDDRLRVEEETDYLQRIETRPDSYYYYALQVEAL
jgi:transposase